MMEFNKENIDDKNIDMQENQEVHEEYVQMRKIEYEAIEEILSNLGEMDEIETNINEIDQIKLDIKSFTKGIKSIGEDAGKIYGLQRFGGLSGEEAMNYIATLKSHEAQERINTETCLYNVKIAEINKEQEEKEKV